MTHLTIKALRHDHQRGLLVPAEVDLASGYRRYTVEQVPTALLIGRLRGLNIALPDVRRVLSAATPDERNDIIRDHLEQMEGELDRTRDVVSSLRELLLTPAPPITHQVLVAEAAVAVQGTVSRADIAGFCEGASATAYGALTRAGIAPAGPGSATYPTAFFTDGSAKVLAFVPVPPDTAEVSGVVRIDLPAITVAAAMHVGAYDHLDQTYAALGVHQPQPAPAGRDRSGSAT